MNNEKNTLRKLLWVAGAIEIFVALLHFVMPFFMSQNLGFKLLKGNELDFIILLIHATGILLFAFGSFTIYLSRRIQNALELIYFYLIIQVLLWLVRVLLELYFPVEIDLFFIDPFTSVVLPGVVFELFLFTFAFFLSMRMRNDITWEQSL